MQPFGSMGGAVYHVEMDTREAFIHTVVTDIQVAAGAAPYSTVGELVDTFLSLADRIPDSPSKVDLMVLRRLFADVTRRVYEHAGAAPPLRPVVNLVADADDPRVEFKAALAALRRQGTKSNGHNVMGVRV